jgi:mono/diheme cytochrome c family protein
MSRAAGCSLFALGLQLAWSLALAQPGERSPQDPMAGARVFAIKGCAACHAVTRTGPPPAPDLRRIASPRSIEDLAGAMWNHPPQVRQPGLREPRLEVRESGHLIAFLFMLGYLDTDGDARAGQQRFTEKKCVICHQVGGTGGVAGPSLDRFKDYGAPIAVAAVMWNHGPRMTEAMQALGIKRPILMGSELRDLVAYLRSASTTEVAGPLHLLPGDADRGRRVFVETCIACHARGKPGLELAGRRARRNLIEFATKLWNKAPAMTTTMKGRAVVSPRLGDGEMADLVAYLDSIAYFASAGDAKRGQKLASDKGCLVCHSAYVRGAQIAGTIIQSQDLESPAAMISLAWNHAVAVAEAPEQAMAAWRLPETQAMIDLMAFVRSLPVRQVKPEMPADSQPQAP